MDSATDRAPVSTASFEDGFGIRHRIVSGTNEPLEVRLFKHDLTGPLFERAIRDTLSRVADFRSPSFGVARVVVRDAKTGSFGLVSEPSEGVRLAEILVVAEQQQLSL